MSFIRVKNIGRNSKKYRYAYLVENKWRKRLKGGKKGSRQKVSKYLGKVVKIEKEKEQGFFEFIDVKENARYLENSKIRIVKDLVRYELFIRKFESKGDVLEKGDIVFDLKQRRFIDSKGDEVRLVIEMNEGFLCKYTINRVVNFRAKGDDEREIGIELAKAFLEAGLNVPKEIFVAYFEKV